MNETLDLNTINLLVNILYMNILFASGNYHKKTEMEALLKDHSLFLPKEKGFSFNCEENAPDFIGNALIKAKSLSKQAPDWNILADDSGLIVPSLPGELGVKTARYGMKQFGCLLSDKERNELLLKNIEGKDRKAIFICSIVFLTPTFKTYIIQEQVEGHIVKTPKGVDGFGYDPIFFVDELGCTMAELPLEEKNKYSHRARAASKIAALLNWRENE